MAAVTLDHLIASDPALVMLIGDLTYADDHLLNDSSVVDLAGWWDGAPLHIHMEKIKPQNVVKPLTWSRALSLHRDFFLMFF